ncbi:MAG: hypothetical protein EOM40_01325 [Clostridia bacterium]|nr:hypothetical protein [Clostridia bacterium]NCC42714.1 hypothetical protein [Clostridia bacterium]
MFGYVAINMEEMKIKDYRVYRAFYCGICQDLKEMHGQSSRLTLTYDMTFLSILLSGLYEKEVDTQKHFCAIHPLKKHMTYRNELTAYAADMNVLLSYYNMLDDWFDEKKPIPLVVAGTLKDNIRRIKEKYPRQTKAVLRYLKKLKACETEKSTDLDRASGYTGELMAEIFLWKKDNWEDILRKVGYYLGKYIYLMDAWEDVEKDRKKGNYNPWASISTDTDFHQRSGQILTVLAAECSRQFEKLPILEYVDILRNILYSGIWTKYDLLMKKNEEKK